MILIMPLTCWAREGGQATLFLSRLTSPVYHWDKRFTYLLNLSEDHIMSHTTHSERHFHKCHRLPEQSFYFMAMAHPNGIEIFHAEYTGRKSNPYVSSSVTTLDSLETAIEWMKNQSQ